MVKHGRWPYSERTFVEFMKYTFFYMIHAAQSDESNLLEVLMLRELLVMNVVLLSFVACTSFEKKLDNEVSQKTAPLQRTPADDRLNEYYRLLEIDELGSDAIVSIPKNCSQGKAFQRKLAQEYSLVVSISSLDDPRVHTCGEALKYLSKVEQFAQETDLNKRVRPSVYLKISILSETAFDRFGHMSFGALGKLFDSEQGRLAFYYEPSYTTYPSLLRYLKSAFESLPFNETPAADEFRKSNAIYNFAYCGTVFELQYVSGKEIGVRCYQNKESELTRRWGPKIAQKRFHMASDLAGQKVLPPDDRILLVDIRSESSFDGEYYRAGKNLNSAGRDYYERTLKCVAQYLGGRTSWDKEEYEKSGCFIMPQAGF